MRMKRVSTIVSLTLVVVCLAFGQRRPKHMQPNPEYQKLGGLVGHWTKNIPFKLFLVVPNPTKSDIAFEVENDWVHPTREARLACLSQSRGPIPTRGISLRLQTPQPIRIPSQILPGQGELV